MEQVIILQLRDPIGYKLHIPKAWITRLYPYLHSHQPQTNRQQTEAGARPIQSPHPKGGQPEADRRTNNK
jgi:hypothetical protein